MNHSGEWKKSRLEHFHPAQTPNETPTMPNKEVAAGHFYTFIMKQRLKQLYGN